MKNSLKNYWTIEVTISDDDETSKTLILILPIPNGIDSPIKRNEYIDDYVNNTYGLDGWFVYVIK